MSKVLKADCSAATIAQVISPDFFAGGHDDVYVEFRMLMTPAALAFFTSPGNYANFHQLDVSDGPPSVVHERTFLSDPGAGDYWFNGGGEGSVPAPVANTWVLVRLHWDADGNFDMSIDGTPVCTAPADGGAGFVLWLTNLGINEASATDPDAILYFDDYKIGTTPGGSEIFADGFEDGTLDAWAGTVGDVSVVDDPLGPPTPTPQPPTVVFGQDRFYEAPPWRIIFSDLNDALLTFVDRRAQDRQITISRAAARVMTCRVPSDDPEINIPSPTVDDDPFVAEGVRLVSFFRREGGTDDAPRWRIRGRGLSLTADDQADSDAATTTITAYDPWKYLYRRPVLLADGSFPGETGRVYPAGTSASDIILEQFQLAVDNGTTIFTDFADGTLETTTPLPDGGDGIAITFQRGTSLGEMLDILVATGTCDVVFEPIYEPIVKPGILCQLQIYEQQGDFRPQAIFGWDRWPRTLVQLSRLVDGTQRANRIKMFAGQGGPPVPEQDDAASIAEFGDYWATQNLTGVPSIAGARTIAERQLALLKAGALTYGLTPAAERAPRLFDEYREADFVPIYASKRFRKAIPGDRVRIESIPIVIGDDQLERVQQMLVSWTPPSEDV